MSVVELWIYCLKKLIIILRKRKLRVQGISRKFHSIAITSKIVLFEIVFEKMHVLLYNYFNLRIILG